MTPTLVTWLAILAFLLGLIALVMEVFIFPGFGAPGIIGVILVGWGILLIAVDVTQIMSALVLALIASIVVFVIGLKLMSRYRMWQRIALHDKQQSKEGYIAPLAELEQFINKEGIALTPLRPSGTMEVRGYRVDVVTGGEFIEPGSKIKVIKIEGTKVLVREVDKD